MFGKDVRFFQNAAEGKPGEPTADDPKPERKHNRIYLDIRIGEDNRAEVVPQR